MTRECHAQFCERLVVQSRRPTHPYGFRPKRSQHDALDALVVGISSKKVNFILDADIQGFFDAVSQPGWHAFWSTGLLTRASSA